jgi:hypothetical protein
MSGKPDRRSSIECLVLPHAVDEAQQAEDMVRRLKKTRRSMVNRGDHSGWTQRRHRSADDMGYAMLSYGRPT